MLPSFVVAFAAGKLEVLFAGLDAGKAKEVYAANVENPKLDAIQLFVRPEYTRRNAPAKHVERSKQKSSESELKPKAAEQTEQPKRKATK